MNNIILNMYFLIIYGIPNYNQFLFSVGGSYNEKLYIGATVGLPTINYHEKSTYTEDSFEDTTINGLQEFNFKEELNFTLRCRYGICSTKSIFTDHHHFFINIISSRSSIYLK